MVAATQINLAMGASPNYSITFTATELVLSRIGDTTNALEVEFPMAI